MQKKEFIRQLNELVPRPDPVTTEALYRFDRECAESEYIDSQPRQCGKGGADGVPDAGDLRVFLRTGGGRLAAPKPAA